MKLTAWIATPDIIINEMLLAVKINSKDIVYDLGCGDGRILISAILEFSAKKAVGYEISPSLCELANKEILSLNLQKRIKIINCDLLEADVSDASVITLYLTSEANELIKPKLEQQLRPNSRVISYMFPINGWKATEQIEIKSIYQQSRHSNLLGMIYLYHIPQVYNSEN